MSVVVSFRRPPPSCHVSRNLHAANLGEGGDAAGTGAADAMVETFAQLDELFLTLSGF